MTEPLQYTKIVFKAGPAETRGPIDNYLISKSELDRLMGDIASGVSASGVYDVFEEPNQPRKLFLRFHDVLYIG